MQDTEQQRSGDITETTSRATRRAYAPPRITAFNTDAHLPTAHKCTTIHTTEHHTGSVLGGVLS